MTIYVDADVCPVTRIVEKVAKEYLIPVVLLCDTNHVMTSDYSTVKVIGEGADAAGFALINMCTAGDIVVTQDYGVAAMAPGKARRLSIKAASSTPMKISTYCLQKGTSQKPLY